MCYYLQETFIAYTKIYRTNTFSAKLQFKQYKLAPISRNEEREIYYLVDIFLALRVCFTSSFNGFNNWCPRTFFILFSVFLIIFLVAFFWMIKQHFVKYAEYIFFILILSPFSFKRRPRCAIIGFCCKEYWNTTVTTITR